MSLWKLSQILLLALALGAYSAWLRSEQVERPAASGQSIPATDIALLCVVEAKALWAQSSTLFVDSRSTADYSFGHIAGAISFPEEDFDNRFPELEPKLQHAKAIVVYCKSADCGSSFWLALRLRQKGLSQVRIYQGGWNDWYLQGLPTAGNGNQ